MILKNITELQNGIKINKCTTRECKHNDGTGCKLKSIDYDTKKDHCLNISC